MEDCILNMDKRKANWQKRQNLINYVFFWGGVMLSSVVTVC